jgi:hypothetical protein
MLKDNIQKRKLATLISNSEMARDIEYRVRLLNDSNIDTFTIVSSPKRLCEVVCKDTTENIHVAYNEHSGYVTVNYIDSEENTMNKATFKI